MKKFKSVIAGLMCMCMILSTNGLNVYATDSNSGEEDAYVEDVSTDTDAVEQETPLLNYMVVGSDYITSGDEQFVLADIGVEGTVIDAATMTYVNNTTGETYEVDADTILDTTVLFKFNPEIAGSYVVSHIEITVAGVSYTIVIADTGVNASFGVDTVVETTPDGVIVDGETANAETDGVVITDVASGEELSSKDIAVAIAEVAVPGVVQSGRSGKLVVVLDPGHGNAGDPGAVYTWNGVTYTERDINLKIAKYCKEKLETYANVTVYMTRTDNSSGLQMAAEEGQVLGELVQFAKDKGADILVSIHNNSSGSPATNGSEVYYPNTNYNSSISATGKGVAEAVLEKLAELGLYDRGALIRNSGDNTLYPDGSLADYYGVIRQSKLAGFPGIIIEHAYLSNQSDAQNFLGSEEKLKAIGYADAEAIADYFDLGEEEEKDTEAYKRRYKKERVYIKDATTVYNGVDYSAVYDFNYYVNSDDYIRLTYADDPEGAIKYFVTKGMPQGQKGNAEFDVIRYKDLNADLQMMYGDNLVEYYLYYMRNNVDSSETTSENLTVQNPTTIYNGVDYQYIYDYNYYINRYPELREQFGTNDEAVLAYFVEYGMNEGHVAKGCFDVRTYLYTNKDIRDKYNTSLKDYYYDYIGKGYLECYATSDDVEMQDYVTVYNGVDYRKVYDFDYYVANNDIVKEKFMYDDYGALAYFVETGMANGDVASAGFNVNYYKNDNEELQKMYGDDLESYYYHYMTHGYDGERVSIKGELSSGDSAAEADKELTAIMGDNGTTVDQMVAYYNSRATYPDYYANSDAPTIEDFCQIYLEECETEGVKAEIAFCQAMKETGFLKYGGKVTIDQYNFAGLGAEDGGGTPATFDSVRDGIRAHVQHLKAYGSTEDLVNECVDPRFKHVTRGSAIYVEWLGINENPKGVGWATAKKYGYTLISDYIDVLKTY